MAYVIVQGNVQDRSHQESLAMELTEVVARLFHAPFDDVVVVIHGGSADGIVASLGGLKHTLELEVTVEGAGIGEGGIARVVQEVTSVAAKVTAREPERIMVLVKVPGGPHMKSTSSCCGIGGELLSQ